MSCSPIEASTACCCRCHDNATAQTEVDQVGVGSCLEGGRGDHEGEGELLTLGKEVKMVVMRKCPTSFSSGIEKEIGYVV